MHAEEPDLNLQELGQPPEGLVDPLRYLWDGGGDKLPVARPRDPAGPGLYHYGGQSPDASEAQIHLRQRVGGLLLLPAEGDPASPEGAVIDRSHNRVPEGLQQVIVNNQEGTFAMWANMPGPKVSCINLWGLGIFVSSRSPPASASRWESITKKQINVIFKFEHVL